MWKLRSRRRPSHIVGDGALAEVEMADRDGTAVVRFRIATGHGSVEADVTPGWARAFADRLDAAATRVDVENEARSITAEGW